MRTATVHASYPGHSSARGFTVTERIGNPVLPTYLRRDGDGLMVVDDKAFPATREVFLLSRREALRAPHLRRVFDALTELFQSTWPR